MVEENWKPVTTRGYENHYEVSDLGNVRNAKTKRILKPGNHPKGYLTLVFSVANARKTVLVHPLVLEAFVGPRPSGYGTRHLDGNRKNNVLTNLVWGTQSENEQDKVNHGTSQQGSGNAMVKLTDEQVLEIIRRHNAGESQRALASGFGVKQPQVSRIITGKRWGHLSLEAKTLSSS